MIRRPPRSTQSRSSAASDVYKRQKQHSPTPIQTDNSTAEGIANDTVKAKRSKAMDMRFYWIKDRVHQGQFRIHWKPGADNKADCHTKHHPPSHHIGSRPSYLHVTKKSIQPECNLVTHASGLEGVLNPVPRDSILSQSCPGYSPVNPHEWIPVRAKNRSKTARRARRSVKDPTELI